MRVVTWNLRSATEASSAWDYFLELEPDLALLQDVVSAPARVLSLFSCQARKAIGRAGSPQKFTTCLLVRGSIRQKIALTHERPWLNNLLNQFAGNLVSHHVDIDDGSSLRALSVYSPAWRIDSLLPTLNPKELDVFEGEFGDGVYLTDVLLAALKQKKTGGAAAWVVGGDFNLSENFEWKWGSGPRGNKEFLDAMAGLRLVECLRHANGKLVPTFRHCRGTVEDQIDHLFVSAALAKRLISCSVGDQDRVFGQCLSDHLPIVAEFGA
jgi:hypothetical protein